MKKKQFRWDKQEQKTILKNAKTGYPIVMVGLGLLLLLMSIYFDEVLFLTAMTTVSIILLLAVFLIATIIVATISYSWDIVRAIVILYRRWKINSQDDNVIKDGE